MNIKIKELFLSEAIKIADNLLQSVENEDGIYWKTLSMDWKLNLSYEKSINIYDGNCGISLFLLEVYKLTKSKKYIIAIKKNLKWIESIISKDESQNYSFLTGKMGICYLYLKLYEVENSKIFLKKAIALSKNCDRFLYLPYTQCEYLTGAAGTLFVLLLIYSYSKDVSILEKIELYIDYILDRINYSKKGIFWDISPNHVKGLCGFSHGVSGIGFVFLELGKYFKNDAFKYIAEQAFLYESTLYDQNINNWLDLRKDLTTQESINNYKNEFKLNNLDFFVNGSDINAWCHGAAGIGLVRIRAYSNSNKLIYKQEILKAIKKNYDINGMLSDYFQTYTLCHGGFGIAELFLEANKIFRNEEFENFIQRLAIKAIETKTKFGTYLSGYSNSGNMEDYSLFMGNAGIGLFYLRILDQTNVNSILIPSLKESKPAYTITKRLKVKYSLSKIRKLVVRKFFPRTIEILTILFPEYIENYFNKQISFRINEKSTILAFIRNFKKENVEYSVELKEIYKIELKKIRLEESIKSYTYLQIKEILMNEEINYFLNLNEEDLFNIKFKLYPDIKLIKTLTILREPGKLKHNKKFILLKPTISGILEIHLDEFNANIISKLNNEITLKDLNIRLSEEYDMSDITIKEKFNKFLILQIKELVKSGIIMTYTPK